MSLFSSQEVRQGIKFYKGRDTILSHVLLPTHLLLTRRRPQLRCRRGRHCRVPRHVQQLLQRGISSLHASLYHIV